MLKVYALVIIIGILGGVGYAAKSYYTSTQNTIATLRENNVKLETAIDISEQSIETLQQDMERFAEANQQLQSELQKAEAYGDDLRTKLREHNLTSLAIQKPGLLEGKMNGATANLWREIEQDTGNNNNDPLPEWLQSDSEARTRGTDSNSGGESLSTDSGTAETSRPD